MRASKLQTSITCSGALELATRLQSELLAPMVEDMNPTPEVGLFDLLQHDAISWCALVEWNCHELEVRRVRAAQRRARNASSSEELDPTFAQLQAVMSTPLDSLDRAAAEIREAAATIELLEACTAAGPTIRKALGALGMESIARDLELQQQQAQAAYLKLQEIKAAILHRMPGSPELLEILSAESHWTSLTLREVHTLLRVSKQDDKSELALPSELLDAIPWLSELKGSELFSVVWHTLPADYVGVACIKPSARSWQQLWASLGSAQISSQTLSAGIARAASKEEITLLGRTFQGPESPAADADMQWVSRVVTSIEQWIHLDSIHQHGTELRQKLELLRRWVGKSQQGFQATEQALSEVMVFMENKRPEKFLLCQVAPIVPRSSVIDPSLVQMNVKLLKQICDSENLLRWLRTKNNDQVLVYSINHQSRVLCFLLCVYQEFVTSLEMAMGKSEMECPASMWVERPGEPGRVNEELLSMLQAVRIKLYNFIYRPTDVFESLEDVVEHMVDMPTDFDGVILQQLEACSVHLEGLTELLSDDQEATVANRLLQLHNPRRNAMWVCSSTPPATTKGAEQNRRSKEQDGFVWLEYSSLSSLGLGVSGTGPSCLELQELGDFQASIVLGSASERTEEVETAVARFNAQFNWLREILDSFLKLQQSGHFECASFDFRCSFDEDPATFRAKATELAQMLSDWEHNVIVARTTFPNLNYCGIKQLRKVMSPSFPSVYLLCSRWCTRYGILVTSRAPSRIYFTASTLRMPLPQQTILSSHHGYLRASYAACGQGGLTRAWMPCNC